MRVVEELGAVQRGAGGGEIEEGWRVQVRDDEMKDVDGEIEEVCWSGHDEWYCVGDQ